MSNAFSKPVLIPPVGDAVVLERVPLTGPDSRDDYSENWLQDLLYRFPQALPIAEIDDGYLPLIPVCKEMNTPVGSVDVVYITPSGRPVIVEAKLWRNPDARRKVVGQILDYAKELSRWSYESFDAAVRAARRAEAPRSRAVGLFDLARQIAPDADEARFCDSVTQSLRRGDLLLLIVGDGIREGVGAITEFLEGHGTLHFTFGLIEMAIHRMPDGSRLVQPRVLAQSTIIRRTIVQLEGAGLVAKEQSTAEIEAEDGIGEDLIQTREQYTQFWSEFLEKLELDDKGQPISKPGKSTNQFFKMPSPAAWISAYLAQSGPRIGVYLTFAKGSDGDRLYKMLEEDKDAVTTALGVPADWESDGAKHWIISRRQFSNGVLIEDHRQEVQSWLADRVNRYVNVFRPRIERMVRESESQVGV